jgi:phytoene synthase
MTTDYRTEIFKEGSKTYFNSSIFFSKEILEEVKILYAFVRIADNFVDSVPQQPEKFNEFVEEYRRGLKKGSDDPVIGPFIELAEKRNFEEKWTEAFFDSMRWDLSSPKMRTIDESLKYIYGSAEVIGLYMAKILELEETAFNYAKMLGRAMQYANFIRDIDEDNSFGRVYLPLEGSGFSNLEKDVTGHKPLRFRSFVQNEIRRFMNWQTEAEKGFRFIPYRSRIAVATASDMYKWTMKKIYDDPFVIYDMKVKPSKFRIYLTAALNTLKMRVAK